MEEIEREESTAAIMSEQREKEQGAADMEGPAANFDEHWVMKKYLHYQPG